MGPMEFEELDVPGGKLFILGEELHEQFMEVMRATGLIKYFEESDED